jgi:hypothetical protein
VVLGLLGSTVEMRVGILRHHGAVDTFIPGKPVIGAFESGDRWRASLSQRGSVASSKIGKPSKRLGPLTSR